ncbi:hypothetical protein [Mesorhizobium erdmanii]|uniref:hypothetical protein n=1 Tax=Mesorhizobium erdmanii TaxID=1777866 RepID=UPI0012B535C2|nr:hypothetical protein [Mesorhizobium erdmanii]
MSALNPQYAQSNGFVLLATGVPILNLTRKGALSKAVRVLADRIPIPEAGRAPAVDSVRQGLSLLVGDVEFSTLKLNDEQNSELASAQNLLFAGDGKTPSPDYKRYLRYKEQYDNVVASLATETNEAAKVSLQTDLQQINSDWSLLGRRGEIDQALETISRLKEGSAEKDYISWTETLTKEDDTVESRILSSLAAGNWLKVSTSDQQGFTPSLVAGKHYPLPPLARLSFDFALVDVHDPRLDDSFLLDRTWRTKSGRVLSDGNSAVDDALEILPRVPVALVIVRNIVVSFKDDADPDVLSAIGKSQDVTIDQIPIKCQGCGGPSYQLRTIAASTPIAIAILASDLAKIPNPNPNRTWLTK